MNKMKRLFISKVLAGGVLLCASCAQQKEIALHCPNVKAPEHIVLVVKEPGSDLKKDAQTGIVYREQMPRMSFTYLGSSTYRPAAPSSLLVANTCSPCEVSTIRCVKKLKEGKADILFGEEADKRCFIPCDTKAIHVEKGGKIKIVPAKEVPGLPRSEEGSVNKS